MTEMMSEKERDKLYQGRPCCGDCPHYVALDDYEGECVLNPPITHNPKVYEGRWGCQHHPLMSFWVSEYCQRMSLQRTREKESRRYVLLKDPDTYPYQGKEGRVCLQYARDHEDALAQVEAALLLGGHPHNGLPIGHSLMVAVGEEGSVLGAEVIHVGSLEPFESLKWWRVGGSNSGGELVLEPLRVVKT